MFDRIYKQIVPKKEEKIMNINYKLKVENDSQEYHFTDLMIQEGGDVSLWIEHTSEMYRTKNPRVVIRYKDITEYEKISQLLETQGANGCYDIDSTLESIKDIFIQIYETIKSNEKFEIKDNKLKSIIDAINNHICENITPPATEEDLTDIQNALIAKGIEVNDDKRVTIIAAIEIMLNGICDALENIGVKKPLNTIPSIIEAINSIKIPEKIDLSLIKEKLDLMGWTTAEATVNSILETLNKTLPCENCGHNNCWYIDDGSEEPPIEDFPATKPYPDPLNPSVNVDPTQAGRGCEEYFNKMFLSSGNSYADYGQNSSIEVKIVYAKQGINSSDLNNKAKLVFQTDVYTEMYGDYWDGNFGVQELDLIDGNENEIITKTFTYSPSGDYQSSINDAINNGFLDACVGITAIAETNSLSKTNFKIWIYEIKVIVKGESDPEGWLWINNIYNNIEPTEISSFLPDESGNIILGPNYSISPWKRYKEGGTK